MSRPTEFHYLRLEVTVEAALVTPEDRVLGDNLVDATVAFGWRIDAPPQGVSDESINAALTKQMTSVLALVNSALVLNGWLAIGQPDERMGAHSRATGVVAPHRAHYGAGSVPRRGAGRP